QEEALSLQAEHPKRVPATERRAWVRFPSDQEVCCQPIASRGAADSEMGWMGRVRDVSLGGIALILKRRFEPNTVLTVDLSTKSGEASCCQLVRVVRVTPGTNGCWIVGCVFANTLTEEQ